MPCCAGVSINLAFTLYWFNIVVDVLVKQDPKQLKTYNKQTPKSQLTWCRLRRLRLVGLEINNTKSKLKQPHI